MRITVFTPTYNRAYIIKKLYFSIQKQTFRDFEWLVLDDGSTDSTKDLFDQWIKEEHDFSIRYYRFENAGKQKEINRALDLAEGELFFTVDSDDLLTENALELIDKWEKTLPRNEKFCGLAGSDGNMDGIPTNPVFHKSFIDATFLNRYPESGLFIGHDRPWVFYTEIHRKYKYPEFEGETFITEAVTWNRMARDGYKIRCFDTVIYLRKHQEDGLTEGIRQIFLKNPKGYGLWIRELLDIFKYPLYERIKREYAFYCEMKSRYKTKEIAEFIDIPFWRSLLIFVMYRIKHGE